MSKLLSAAVSNLPTAKKRGQELLTTFYHTVQKTALFDGMTRRYRAARDGGDSKPPEDRIVQNLAYKELATVLEQQASMIDSVATVDYGNTIATADVVVEGIVLIKAAPIPHILYLIQRVDEWINVLKAMPTLDPAERWQWDSSEHIYRAIPTETSSTSKVQEPIVLYDATPEHPAQTQLVSRDVIVGYWTVTRLSGAVEKSAKEQCLAQAYRLRAALDTAKDEANAKRVDEQQVGKPLVDYVLAPLSRFN